MVNIDNIIKKSEKYLKHMPVLYALYLPINFFIHVYQANKGIIFPFLMNISDLLRVFVIAAFSFYVIKTYSAVERDNNFKHPGERLMTFAGVAFLEWIFNVIMSDAYVESYSHKFFYVVMGLSALIGFYMELRVFFNFSEMYGSFIAFCWIAVNVVLAFFCWRLYIRESRGGFPIIIGAVVIRAIIRAVIIYKYVKDQSGAKDVSIEAG